MPAVVLPSADLPFPGSLPEFQRLFPDDTACAAYLEAIRWRDGFVCGWGGETSGPHRFANPPQGVPRRNGRYAGRIRMEVVPDRSARSLCGFVEAAVEPGAVVVTDAWGGYATLPDRSYRHLPVAAQGDPSVAEDFLPISHLIFSNLKSWLRGCHHGVSPQHLQAYLNEFTFRFNRRFYPFNASGHCWGSAGRLGPRGVAVCRR